MYSMVDRAKFSDRTRREMEAGRIALSLGESYSHLNAIMNWVRQRFDDRKIAAAIHVKVEETFIKIYIQTLDDKVILSEPVDVFPSEAMRAKIMLLTG